MHKIIKDYNMFKGTLKEISNDKENKQSLLDDELSEHRILNFDGISGKFCKKVRGEKNFSCDGYYEKSNGNRYLIEFKNQPEGNIDKVWLKNKIYDSISTLVMNENVTRKEVANSTSVIIVYNDEAAEEKTNTSFNSSESFNLFAQKMGVLSKKTGIDSYDKKFDLARYQNLLFKDVYTIDKRIFEKEFINVLFES